MKEIVYALNMAQQCCDNCKLPKIYKAFKCNDKKNKDIKINTGEMI